MFKKLRSVRLPYIRQGLIYFTCINYTIQPEHVKQKILNTCLAAGGEYYGALFDMMTHGKTATAVSTEHYISEATAIRIRKKFYEIWEF